MLLSIHYHITDWYLPEHQYLEKSLIYNSVSIFFLIDNVQTIQYHFSGKNYQAKRKQVEENYPNYQEIKKNKIDQNQFNQYLENRMNDNEFIKEIFPKIIQ